MTPYSILYYLDKQKTQAMEYGFIKLELFNVETCSIVAKYMFLGIYGKYAYHINTTSVNSDLITTNKYYKFPLFLVKMFYRKYLASLFSLCLLVFFSPIVFIDNLPYYSNIYWLAQIFHLMCLIRLYTSLKFAKHLCFIIVPF